MFPSAAFDTSAGTMEIMSFANGKPATSAAMGMVTSPPGVDMLLPDILDDGTSDMVVPNGSGDRQSSTMGMSADGRMFLGSHGMDMMLQPDGTMVAFSAPMASMGSMGPMGSMGMLAPPLTDVSAAMGMGQPQQTLRAPTSYAQQVADSPPHPSLLYSQFQYPQGTPMHFTPATQGLLQPQQMQQYALSTPARGMDAASVAAMHSPMLTGMAGCLPGTQPLPGTVIPMLPMQPSAQLGSAAVGNAMLPPSSARSMMSNKSADSMERERTRRLKHNAAEVRRTRKITEQIGQLRQLMQEEGILDKEDKASVLNATVQYVEDMVKLRRERGTKRQRLEDPSGISFLSVFHCIATPIAIISVEGNYVDLNPAACQLLHIADPAAVAGSRCFLFDMRRQEELQELCARLSRLLTLSAGMVKVVRALPGLETRVEVSVTVAKDMDGRSPHYVCTLQPTTAEEAPSVLIGDDVVSAAPVSAAAVATAPAAVALSAAAAAVQHAITPASDGFGAVDGGLLSASLDTPQPAVSLATSPLTVPAATATAVCDPALAQHAVMRVGVKRPLDGRACVPA